jgi:hypothetical protein
VGHELARRIYAWGEIVISLVWVTLCYVAQLNDWLSNQVLFMDTIYIVQFLILSTLVLLNGWNDRERDQRRDELAMKTAEHLADISTQNRENLRNLNEEISDLKAMLAEGPLR